MDKVKENISSLLIPILGKIKSNSAREIKEYQFVLYNNKTPPFCDDIYAFTGREDRREVFSLPLVNGEIDIDLLVKKYNKSSPETALGLTSKVITNGGTRHIPMIDFANGIDEYQARDALRSLDQADHFLVKTKNSFHHYGTCNLHSKDEFREYLSLLEKQPEVDPKWPDLQRKRGFSTLRISTSSDKQNWPVIIGNS